MGLTHAADDDDDDEVVSPLGMPVMSDHIPIKGKEETSGLGMGRAPGLTAGWRVHLRSLAPSRHQVCFLSRSGAHLRRSQLRSAAPQPCSSHLLCSAQF